MSREHDDEDQDDGGASAYDRKAAAKARAKAQAAAPMAVPNGCPACCKTGLRTIAEHDREGQGCDLHQTFCGCPLGVHLQTQRGGAFFYACRDAITARFRVAVVDPTPAQCKPGGAILRDIPKLGEYVPRANFQRLDNAPEDYTPENARRGYRYAVPPLTIAEARARLGWPEDGPPPVLPAAPGREPRTAGLLPLSGEALAAHRARLAAPLRPTPTVVVEVPAPSAVAPPVLDTPPPWLDDDAQPPWLR